jgi:hypothetical protein
MGKKKQAKKGEGTPNKAPGTPRTPAGRTTPTTPQSSGLRGTQHGTPPAFGDVRVSPPLPGWCAGVAVVSGGLHRDDVIGIHPAVLHAAGLQLGQAVGFRIFGADLTPPLTTVREGEAGVGAGAGGMDGDGGDDALEPAAPLPTTLAMASAGIVWPMIDLNRKQFAMSTTALRTIGATSGECVEVMQLSCSRGVKGMATKISLALHTPADRDSSEGGGSMVGMTSLVYRAYILGLLRNRLVFEGQHPSPFLPLPPPPPPSNTAWSWTRCRV